MRVNLPGSDIPAVLQNVRTNIEEPKMDVFLLKLDSLDQLVFKFHQNPTDQYEESSQFDVEDNNSNTWIEKYHDITYKDTIEDEIE